MTDRLDAVALALPRTYPGPGGAIAVLRHGEVLLRHTWGWSNAERRIPFTPGSLFRMCSVTKQFTCAALLDAFPDPSVLDAEVARRLPHLTEAPPRTVELCHNQSGLRDYWAVAMLHGSPVEAPFGDLEAGRVISGTRTLQFEPGTRASYCNQNFRLLSDMLQERLGRSFGEVLRARVFAPAGMDSAMLAADTRSMPDGSEGYEGSQASGFRAAENRIVWTGDAGIGASLDDMIAWERHIDATRDDPNSLHGRISGPAAFRDGSAATYGFGLGRYRAHGRAVTGHGGALRGWKSCRLYLPQERVSVVVLFNHMAEARSAAMELLEAVLGERRVEMSEPADAGWTGAYLEPETGLLARVEVQDRCHVRLRFGQNAEVLTMQPDGSATNGSVVLRRTAEGLSMERRDERLQGLLQPRGGEAAADIAGRYRSAELDAELQIERAGGVMYGAFAGFLGAGRMEMLEPIASDLWTLPCPRALDHTPPHDWTLDVRRDGSGHPDSIRVGCWLARGLVYERV